MSSSDPPGNVNQPSEDTVRAALNASDPVAALEPLFAAGLDPNYLLGYQGTLLFRAARRRDARLVRYVLGKGADANFSTAFNSPLNACCSRKNSSPKKDDEGQEEEDEDAAAVEVAGLLLAAGADPDRCDALWHAAYYCNVAVARKILNHGGDGGAALRSLNRFENADMASARDVDFGLGTPLHRLARLERYDDEDELVEFARLLVEKGADPLVKDEKGRTALELAEVEENEEIAKYLKSLQN